MIEALRFVKGAVSSKNIDSTLKTYQIKNGRVTGFNGRIALSSPIDLEIEAYPMADLFLKAIDNCNEATSIHMTPAMRLSIRSGKFKCFVPCQNTVTYEPLPEGETIECQASFIEALESAAQFISEDASRPLTHGVYIKGPFMYATNNVSIVKVYTGLDLPEINLPREAVGALLRAKDNPSKLQFNDHNATFHYEDGRWMFTALIEGTWLTPKLETLFETPAVLQDIRPEWVEALNSLEPFLKEDDNAIYISEEYISTSEDPESGTGATIYEGIPGGNTIFTYKFLQLITRVATKLDATDRGTPCVFQGTNLLGVVLPRR